MPVPALAPSMAMTGTPTANPTAVVPSIVTPVVSLSGGSAVAGEMTCAPPPAMLNWMTSAPGAALASRIAWRSVPAPASAVLVTPNVAISSRRSRFSKPFSVRFAFAVFLAFDICDLLVARHMFTDRTDRNAPLTVTAGSGDRNRCFRRAANV